VDKKDPYGDFRRQREVQRVGRISFPSLWFSSLTLRRWAFVDFTSTEHATAALINPRNHSLDGRKLTVEYASPDAVRRGGGPREPDSSNRPTRTGEGGKRVRKPMSAGYIRKEPKPTDGQLVNDGEGRLEKKRKAAGGGGERAPGRGISERRKPGAALASAQRGTAAILPSQGQKITF
jgi:RNA recognition motif-containing protein